MLCPKYRVNNILCSKVNFNGLCKSLAYTSPLHFSNRNYYNTDNKNNDNNENDNNDSNNSICNNSNNKKKNNINNNHFKKHHQNNYFSSTNKYGSDYFNYSNKVKLNKESEVLPGLKLSDIDLTSSNVMDVSSGFLFKFRYYLPITSPKIVLNSKYKKYAVLIKDNHSFDDILAIAQKDNIEISNDFYNTMFYIYILKLEEIQNLQLNIDDNIDNTTNTNSNNKELINKIIIALKRIYLSNYRPNQLSILLNILSFAKRKDDQADSDLVEFCEDICVKVDLIRNLFTLESLQILLQTLYNRQKFRTVCTVYQSFKNYFPLLNENEVWHSGIIIQSMELTKRPIEEIEQLFEDSGLQLTQYTQVHFNTLALSYLRSTKIAEFFSVLQTLYLAHLPINETLPNRGLQFLIDNELHDFAVKVYPLLRNIFIIERSELSTSQRERLKELVSLSENGKLLLINPSYNNPNSPQYIFSEKYISTIDFESDDTNFSFLGVQIPVKTKPLDHFKEILETKNIKATDTLVLELSKKLESAKNDKEDH
ncbi:hypothetical protein DICPUDRAFT_77822 [Dictyostelium purpureum]|uniref:Uncharacterized protein n=1 Tax=Dictyostelium purpureum TaxID=5786 RepID=F0ZHR3_DICPU|nr:uncharacterized protein DICPUDRAFT_77822 [Dictyostelium purpureum]EGC36507.1 hypothetical protein DICPUDRAFT_77822 [Dictyostelium purpureum]|eukprot:XP_003286952.1 hypothetical protein DICPUDRAFT_77822 [Dictyostelium purpureum]